MLLRHDNRIFSLSAYTPLNPTTHIRTSRLTRWIHAISVNLASVRALGKFGGSFIGQKQVFVLVVGGGMQRHWLDQRFAAFPHIRLIYCDIDIGASVDIYCDAHELPFRDGCFDGVITTAVLEHVLYPERVAAEIHRALKPDGLLYSEIPFMQQVHEGAYDFTRYTLSGHRRLFNRFAEIDSGLVAGPATAFLWSIENLALSFFASRPVRLATKACVRLLFFWVKYFDYLLRNKPQAMDGASCTYFLGRRQDTVVPDEEIIDAYVGGQYKRHV